MLKLRAGLLGLMALLLVGAYSATPAFAVAGPFCHHRAIGGEDEGKIKAQTPEQFGGPGGQQILLGKVGGVEAELVSEGAQAKGVIYNNALQCQSKIDIAYQAPKLVKPAGLPNCVITIGENNKVKLFGHKAWKYAEVAGELEEHPQLHQKPDWIFIPTELAEGAKELPKATFTEIHFGANCGVLTGLTFPVKGSAGAEVIPEQVETWSVTETQKLTKGELKQHFWNGTAYIPVKTGLIFGTEPASYKSEFKIKTLGRQQLAAQELADFEGP
jgi:hypothetical protein